METIGITYLTYGSRQGRLDGAGHKLELQEKVRTFTVPLWGQKEEDYGKSRA
jgi:hypothetical protein